MREPYRSEAPRAPSSVARQRLSREVRREVADLRTRLEEAQLRSEVFLSAGHADAAARALEDQRRLVSDFSRRVDAAVSAAVVEREAERVVAAELAQRPQTEPTRRRTGVPVGAALAGVVAFALVVAGVVRTTPQLDLASDSGEPATPPDRGADLGVEPDIVPAPDGGEPWARPGLRWFLLEPPDRRWSTTPFAGGAAHGPVPDDATLLAELLAGANEVLGEPISVLDEATGALAPAASDGVGPDAGGTQDSSLDAEEGAAGGDPSDDSADPAAGDGAPPAAPADTGSTSSEATPGSGSDDAHATPDGQDSGSADVIGEVTGPDGMEEGLGASPEGTDTEIRS